MRSCVKSKSITKSIAFLLAGKCVSTALKSAAICAAVIAGISCPVSCAMEEGGVEIVKNNYDSPSLESVVVKDERNVDVTFSKTVSPINTYFCTDDGEQDTAKCFGGGDVVTVTANSDLYIGKTYILGGKVKDGGGNTLTFAVPVLGYNSHPAEVIISAVHPKYEKDSKAQNYKDEFIQLYVTKAGNLSGFTLHTGKMGATELFLPTAEVNKGEIVTVHLQALENGCKDETGDNTNLASSRYSSRVRDVWAYLVDYTKGAGEDVWAKNTATNCLSESDEVILLCNGDEVLDAVLYAAEDTPEWNSATSYDLSARAVEKGIWKGAETSCGVVIDKPLTAAKILKRVGAFGGGGQTSSDWVKADFSKSVEQNVLASLGAQEGASTHSDDGEESTGEEGGSLGSSSSGGSSSGSSSPSGGNASASGSTSSSSSGSTGRRPMLSLPAPLCEGTCPRVIISSVHPAYTSAKDSDGDKVYKTEFIQLYALTDGNLSHLTVSTGKLGSRNFYPLPSAPIKAGDIVTVHLRRVGMGCTDETDAKEIYLASAWYTSRELRDVWIDNVYNPLTKKGAAALDREADAVAVYSGRDKKMMDAVLYAVVGTTQWKSADAKDIAQTAQSAGIWESSSPVDSIQVDKSFTPATILQRNGCRELLSASKRGETPSVIRCGTDWTKRPFAKKDEEFLLQFID